jgi:hypothetical protein
MNAYFFKMNKAERNDILDQHRQVYDGFVTTYGQQINQQPLYVQDYANDKGGLTVNNKGEVKSYTNMRINEMRYDGKSTGLFSEEEDTYMTQTEKEFTGEDKIGHSSHMKYGTFDDETEFELELEITDEPNVFDEEPNFIDIDIYELGDEFDVEEEQLQEQVNKTLDMFKRFKNY